MMLHQPPKRLWGRRYGQKGVQKSGVSLFSVCRAAPLAGWTVVANRRGLHLSRERPAFLMHPIVGSPLQPVCTLGRPLVAAQARLERSADPTFSYRTVVSVVPVVPLGAGRRGFKHQSPPPADGGRAFGSPVSAGRPARAAGGRGWCAISPCRFIRSLALFTGRERFQVPPLKGAKKAKGAKGAGAERRSPASFKAPLPRDGRGRPGTPAGRVASRTTGPHRP